MKAVQINRYGGSEVLEVNPNAPEPQLKDGQVLVEVHAASINPFDWKVRAGYMKNMMPLQFPATLGGDFCGVIMQVGTGASDFNVGDEVYGQGNVFGGNSGSFAQVLAVNTKSISSKPKTIDHLQAAAVVLVGVSGLQALEDHIKLQKGQKILIHGGAGGIGSIAIQIAKHLDAYVATTVSSESKDFVKSLGADEIIDYKTEHFEDMLKDYDAVFDTVGGQTLTNSLKVLKKGGVLVSMAGKPDETMASEYGITAIGQMTQVNKERLDRLRELIDSGAIKVLVDKVFPLDQAKEAFDYLEKGHPHGKVVLQVK